MRRVSVPSSWRRAVAVAAVLFLGASAAAFGQVLTGNLYGTTTDAQGEALPGVTVTLSGFGAPRVQVTDAQGQFRFLSLDPGNYGLKADLEGFSTVEYPAVNIRVGRNTTLEITLSPAVEEVITVTAESPLLDSRSISRGTTVSQVELESIPTARDPWAILAQTPGVVTDRVNVGGDESGQQSVFSGGGQQSTQNVFAVDGVIITDMAAVGSSSTYYDFDQFTEVQIGTGGTDVSSATSGVAVNLVTKRGSNQARGSGRFMLTDSQKLFGIFEQADPALDLNDLGPGQTQLAGNSINEITEYGFEAGGAFKKDVLWGWGSYGRNDIKTFNSRGFADDTLLENTALKLNAQVGEANSMLGSFNRGDKLKFGRNTGPNRQPETTWDQAGPTEIFKFEDTHVFNSSLFVTGTYSFVDGGFQLIPKSGFGTAGVEAVQGPDGNWRGGFQGGIDDRNADSYQVDASYFLTTGDINHELKFGGRLRGFEQTSNFAWSGPSQIYYLACENVGLCGAGGDFGLADGTDADLGIAQRVGIVDNSQDYTSLWVSDTLTRGRWTINAGLRYDQQDGENAGSTATVHPIFASDLPGLTFNGNDGGGIEYSDILPRIGVTYALGAEQKTLLRASFAQFASQFDSARTTRVNPVSSAYASFVFTDTNGDNIWQQTEAMTFITDTSVFSSLNSPNLNDPDLEAETTTEVLLGLEHALLPELVVSFDVTYRTVDDIQTLFPLVNDGTQTRVATRADYVFEQTLSSAAGDGAPLPNGSNWTADFYRLRDGVTFSNGYFLTNGDRSRTYTGVSAGFTKRLSNRWMARGYFSYGDADWDIGSGFTALDDPTDAAGRGFGPSNEGTLDEDSDGALYAEQSAGSSKDVWLQSTWTWNLNGMYQVAPDKPWGFNVAANLYGREGYPLPYFAQLTGVDGITRQAAVTSELDSFRTDDLFNVDLRLEKEFRANQNMSVTFSIDAFNIFNEASVQQRETGINSNRADFLEETLSPRIYRLGFRLSWK
ncbi:MAG: TonB-dependent receptor [Thermoanaerobaculia bacterium]|nr:TonB-dependent receptor [Thermoanaerobaculia bacterium]